MPRLPSEKRIGFSDWFGAGEAMCDLWRTGKKHEPKSRHMLARMHGGETREGSANALPQMP